MDPELKFLPIRRKFVFPGFSCVFLAKTTQAGYGLKSQLNKSSPVKTKFEEISEAENFLTVNKNLMAVVR
jgi:hypothetical protein